ncbi:MAG TPA: rhomboid family intramembrane serine protease [Rhizomicrobium sp.]
MTHAKLDGPGTPSLQTLVALGGAGQKLVFADGQWWRVFTAPLMHANVEHIVSNAIALLVAGWLLEPLIGRAWFAAIFFIGALAGSIASLAMTDTIVSVGASGAIMALLAAVLVWCIPFDNVRRGPRLIRTAGFMFFSALLPAAGSNVDIGAHVGGAIAGGVMGFLLQILWPEEDERPGSQNIALGVVVAGLAASLISFVLVAVFPTPDVGQTTLPSLIPQAELPTGATESSTYTDGLVRRYPEDPRGHMLHALALLRLRELPEAQAELRVAMEKSEAPGMEYFPGLPDLRISLRLILAVTMSVQHRVGDAKAILHPGDCERATAPDASSLRAAYQQLQQTGICR